MLKRGTWLRASVQRWKEAAEAAAWDTGTELVGQSYLLAREMETGEFKSALLLCSGRVLLETGLRSYFYTPSTPSRHSGRGHSQKNKGKATVVY